MLISHVMMASLLNGQVTVIAVKPDGSTAAAHCRARERTPDGAGEGARDASARPPRIAAAGDTRVPFTTPLREEQ